MYKTFYGDWDKLFAHVRGLKTAKGKMKSILSEVGHRVAKDARENIYNQKFNRKFAPLSTKTLSKKHGNKKILMDTGHWVDTIIAKDIKEEGSTLTIIIGTEGEDNNALAVFHEYGTYKMPARPIFNLTWRSIREDVKRQFRDEIGKAFFNRLSVRSGEWD